MMKPASKKWPKKDLSIIAENIDMATMEDRKTYMQLTATAAARKEAIISETQLTKDRKL